MTRPFALLGMTLLLATACDHRSPGPATPDAVTELPRQFHLTGTAAGTDADGRAARCSLDLWFELTAEVRRTPQVVDYAGKYGGGLERAVVEKDGSGFAFFPDVYAPIVDVRLFTVGRVELVDSNALESPSRFWRSLGRLGGVVSADGRGSGTWLCAPLDINSGGYVDTAVTVAGTWQFKPTPE